MERAGCGFQPDALGHGKVYKRNDYGRRAGASAGELWRSPRGTGRAETGSTDVAPQSEERRERGKRRVKRAETGKESLSERAGGSKI